MKVKDEILIINPSVTGNQDSGYRVLDGDVVILRTVTSYKVSSIANIQNEYISIGYKPASRIARKLFRWTMKYIRVVPKYQILYSGGKIIKILYTDEDLRQMRDIFKVDASTFPKINTKELLNEKETSKKSEENS